MQPMERNKFLQPNAAFKIFVLYLYRELSHDTVYWLVLYKVIAIQCENYGIWWQCGVFMSQQVVIFRHDDLTPIFYLPKMGKQPSVLAEVYLLSYASSKYHSNDSTSHCHGYMFTQHCILQKPMKGNANILPDYFLRFEKRGHEMKPYNVMQ